MNYHLLLKSSIITGNFANFGSWCCKQWEHVGFPVWPLIFLQLAKWLHRRPAVQIEVSWKTSHGVCLRGEYLGCGIWSLHQRNCGETSEVILSYIFLQDIRYIARFRKLKWKWRCDRFLAGEASGGILRIEQLRTRGCAFMRFWSFQRMKHSKYAPLQTPCSLQPCDSCYRKPSFFHLCGLPACLLWCFGRPIMPYWLCGEEQISCSAPWSRSVGVAVVLNFGSQSTILGSR